MVADAPSNLVASVRLSARVRVTFSCLCKSKVTKENTPRMPRSRDKAARVREIRPGFVERTSLSVQRTRAHRARDPADISVPPSPRQTGTDRKPRAGCAPRFSSSGSPLHCGGSGRSGPRGAREDRAHSAIAHGRAISGIRPLTRTLWAGCPKGAMLWGAFSLVTFSWASKRKSPARPQDEWKLLLQKQSWISACAEMTSENNAAEGTRKHTPRNETGKMTPAQPPSKSWNA